MEVVVNVAMNCRGEIWDRFGYAVYGKKASVGQTVYHDKGLFSIGPMATAYCELFCCSGCSSVCVSLSKTRAAMSSGCAERGGSDGTW